MEKSINVLGISAYYHDSAACIVVDGKIVAAAQEERFTRKKHDAAFPSNAIKDCLASTGLTLADIDYVTFYDKPLIKFERLLETYLAYVPNGFRSFLMAIPVWLKEKLFLKITIKKELAALSASATDPLPQLLFHEHHGSHAASAFFPSPFESAVVICLDGVGEWATTSVWLGKGNQLIPQWEIQFPHSLGLLYSAFTFYAGFKVNSGEYKLMGLAPYGEPRYVDKILEHLIDIKDDGTFRLNMKYFGYATGLTMTNRKFDVLFDGPPRSAESPLTQKEMDLAASIQIVTEMILLKLASSVHREFGVNNLCLAGGVALNCVANGRLQREGPFESIWIQPAAGDAGGALGAALATWHEYLDKPRKLATPVDAMRGAFLGRDYAAGDICAQLDLEAAVYVHCDDGELMPILAELLDDGKVIGWFSGPMEFGPRALGARSIIGDPRNPLMQSTMNLKIKNRESFRPFAPAVKADKAREWFDLDVDSPYMLFVANVVESCRHTMTAEQAALFGLDKLNVPRSTIPAVTHVDYSARIQTVHASTNPRFYHLLDAFEQLTGCPVLINTSFNVRGEPIVGSPADAYRCFMRTEMDYLVINNVLLNKQQQPNRAAAKWQQDFELD